MTKEEIIRKIDEEHPHINHIKSWIENMHFKKYVSFLRKGDVLSSKLYKNRPIVIIKIDKEIIYGIPLSTTKDELNLCPYTSRQFGKGFFSKSIICLKKEFCLDNFIGTLDSFRDLNFAIELLKNLFFKI